MSAFPKSVQVGVGLLRDRRLGRFFGGGLGVSEFGLSDGDDFADRRCFRSRLDVLLTSGFVNSVFVSKSRCSRFDSSERDCRCCYR